MSKHRSATEKNKRYGATEHQEVSDLLPRHRSILCKTLEAIYEIAKSESEHEREIRSTVKAALSDETYEQDVLRREPVFSILIDGPRGSGKTSLTLSIRYFSDLLCRDDKKYEAERKLGAELAKCGVSSSNGGYFKPIEANNRGRQLIHGMPLLRPDHMETSETIMEGVFAQMSERLDLAISETGALEDRKKRAKLLKQELHGSIAKGWYFSRRLGVEALLNDSMNFEEYIERRSEEATQSHTRIKRWRLFVLRYLDFFEAELLGIFIDDTDVSNKLTVDLIHSIRMYFCHPRIVTVVAGNMHTMRQRLLQDAMTNLHDATKALRSSDSFTSAFWRRFERENIEEYLEKVFPRPMRHFISTGSVEVARLLESKTFSQYCSDEMALRLPTFCRYRRLTCRDQDDPTTLRYHGFDRENNRVENYLALWLLKNHYFRKLTPSTARHMNQFVEFLSERSRQELGGNPVPAEVDRRKERRVAVALFTEPRNFELVQRFTDRDESVIDWLSQHRLSASWREPRHIQINQLPLSFGVPSVEFLFFRIDLEFAMPKYAQHITTFPVSLLPRVAGHNVWAPEVWETWDRQTQVQYIKKIAQNTIELNSDVLRLRQETFGLAQVLNSPVIPANCLYFRDMRALPDVTWRAASGENPHIPAWDELPAEDVDILFHLDRYDTRNAYFRDVVLMFGTFPITKPIPSDEYRQQFADLLEFEALSLGEDPVGPSIPDWALDSRKLGRKAKEAWIKQWHDEAEDEWVDLSNAFRGDRFFYGLQKALARKYRDIARNRGALGNAAAPSSAWAALDSISQDEYEAALGRKKNLATEKPDAENFTKARENFFSFVVPRYHRILCDVRRAHSALRIYENDLNDYAAAANTKPATAEAASVGSDEDEGEHQVLFNHGRNDKIRLIGLHKIRTALGLTGFSYNRHSIASQQEGSGRASKVSRPAAFESRVGDAQRRDTRYFQGFTNPPPWAHHQNGMPIFSTRNEATAVAPSQAADSEMNARAASHMRSLLLFLWGIGPTLSSLIHIEVMGEWYWWENEFRANDANLDRTVKDKRNIQVQEIIAQWDQTLQHAEKFVADFASLLEQTIGRQIDGRESASNEKFTPLPDFSISTLGLRMIRCDASSQLQKTEHFEGIIGDVILRLQLGRWYLTKLMAWQKSKVQPAEKVEGT